MNIFSKLLTKPAKINKSSNDEMLLNTFFTDHYYPHALLTKRRPHYDLHIYNKHVRESLGTKSFKELTNAVLDQWVRDHIVKKYKPGTINKHIFLVNRLFNVAKHWGLIEVNLFDRRTIKRLSLGDYTQYFLTEPEVKDLLSACQRDQHPFLYLFAKLLLLTGARKGEARTAHWRDFNMGTRIWTVPVSKNGKSRRIVLSAAAVQVLKDIRVQADRLYLPTARNDYLFINPKSQQPYHSFYCAWERARQKADLPTVRIHDLRHTFASFLINKGASIYEVQTLLGHHHVSMTERYAHLMPNTLQDRVDIMATLLE
jgi:integrase